MVLLHCGLFVPQLLYLRGVSLQEEMAHFPEFFTHLNTHNLPPALNLSNRIRRVRDSSKGCIVHIDLTILSERFLVLVDSAVVEIFGLTFFAIGFLFLALELSGFLGADGFLGLG